MLDDLERLRTSEPLRQLLAHYGQLAEANREIWQDRLMALEGVEARELTKLHGLLLAMDWIELNVAHFSGVTSSPVPACYRMTNAGLRVLRRVKAKDSADEADEVLAVDEVPAAPLQMDEESVAGLPVDEKPAGVMEVDDAHAASLSGDDAPVAVVTGDEAPAAPKPPGRKRAKSIAEEADTKAA